jgi:hypothetical protein
MTLNLSTYFYLYFTSCYFTDKIFFYEWHPPEIDEGKEERGIYFVHQQANPEEVTYFFEKN